MPTDTERMDFLESLRNKTVFVTTDNPDYYLDATMRISGPDKCSIFVRNHAMETIYRGFGSSLREAIDDAIEDKIRTFGK